MGDPHEVSRISVTLKQDGKDGTWIVFHGSAAEVRSQIIEVMGMDSEKEKDSPLFDLINEATRLYKAAGNVSSGLGGRVVTRKSSDETGPTGSGSAWERAAGNSGEATSPTPEVDPEVARIEQAIEDCMGVPALQELYARNKATFDSNADLMTAWKSKGRALSPS